ncbi:MAG TPA: hypothetical protein VIU11_02410 [Nakamurella sp.]
MGLVVDDDVHAVDRRQGRGRQRHRDDHRKPFDRDGHYVLVRAWKHSIVPNRYSIWPRAIAGSSSTFSTLSISCSPCRPECLDLDHPGVDLEHAVPGPEHLLQELLGVAKVTAGHAGRPHTSRTRRR